MVRFKIPNSVCGRPPITYLCDAVPIGFTGAPPPASQEWSAVTYDNGTKRIPSQHCVPDQFCKYGMVTYAFGRNNYAQLGVGDYVDRKEPTPLSTVYARISKLRCGAQSCILQWEGPNTLYSWGRDDHGQLGQGAHYNDTLPNEVQPISIVELAMGFQHTVLTTPPSAVDFFEYDGFAGAQNDFVFYGQASQPIAPATDCPRCVPWEGTPVPAGVKQTYSGRQCYSPSWAAANGIKLVNTWCWIGQFAAQPCSSALKAPIGINWWISPCSDLALFSITPNPPLRLTSGAIWRKQKVNVYDAWQCGFFFSISKNDPTGGGNGIVFAIQNHGIQEQERPLGGSGSDLGIARSTKTSLSDGIPNSFGIEISTAPGKGGINVRGCYGAPYTTITAGSQQNCFLVQSEWKPRSTCNVYRPETCCSDAQLQTVNSCFMEDVKDGAMHQLLIVYRPFVIEIFLDDTRSPKIRHDLDLRSHISSYVCSAGPKQGAACKCDGGAVCGGAVDTVTCLAYSCVKDGKAWIGFTSSTGDAYSVHEVLSWNFQNFGQSGGVDTFGFNLYSQLGLGDAVNKDLPNLITSLDGVVILDFDAGAYHSIAVTTSGDVYTWGANNLGQLGQGDLSIRTTPTRVRFLQSAVTSAQNGDPCICGKIDPNCAALPAVLPCTFKPVKVSAGAYHSLVVVQRDAGAHEVWGWGDNSFGQLGCLVISGDVKCPWTLQGPGTRGNWPQAAVLNDPCSGSNVRCMSIPRKLSMFDPLGDSGMVFSPLDLVSGSFHNVLITASCASCPMPSLCSTLKLSRADCDCDGGARSRNTMLGASADILSTTPCIARDGEIYTWGSNVRGQLGTNCSGGENVNSPSQRMCPDSPLPIRLNSDRPIPLLPYMPSVFPFLGSTMVSKPTQVTAREDHNLLIMSDGTLLVWGSNYYGELGKGDHIFSDAPTKVPYFEAAELPAPNVSPLDGLGDSIKTLPPKDNKAMRPVSLVAAGLHHSVVATECVGAGFTYDGLCNCRRGWKGPDCNIRCNGGTASPCSNRGTFDKSNRVGDRATCKSYLDSLARQGLWNNNGTCVGLKTSETSTKSGCPGTLVANDCPQACQFCDAELYDCENDGTCTCTNGYTGPDCGMQCIPKEPQYNFQTLGGQALCQCKSCYTGQYCNVDICNVSGTSIATTPAGSQTSAAQREMTGCAALLALLVMLWSLR